MCGMPGSEAISSSSSRRLWIAHVQQCNLPPAQLTPPSDAAACETALSLPALPALAQKTSSQGVNCGSTASSHMPYRTLAASTSSHVTTCGSTINNLRQQEAS